MSNSPENVRAPLNFTGKMRCKRCGEKWAVEYMEDLGMTWLINDTDEQCPSCESWDTEEI